MRDQPAGVLLWLRPGGEPPRGDLGLLDEVERARLASFTSEQSRRPYAALHVLARRAVADVVGIAPDRLRFDRTCAECGAQHGRPSLPGHPWLHLSLSRTQRLVAVALSTCGRVGVDVEAVERTDFDGFPDVALHPGERAAVEGDLAGRLRRRAVSWARKEAALKALGLGLTLAPASIVTPPSGIRARLGDGDHDVTVLDLDDLDDLDDLQTGTVGAVALVGDHATVTVERR